MLKILNPLLHIFDCLLQWLQLMHISERSSARQIQQPISRRKFLHLLAYLTGGAAATALLSSCTPGAVVEIPELKVLGTKDEVFGIPNLAEHLDFAQAATIARRFDRAWQRLPELAFEVNEQTVARFLTDIAHMFAYNGYSGAHLDTPVVFETYEDSLSHLRVLGQTNCIGEKISLNRRFITPESAWYNSNEAFAAAVHEHAHNAQGREFCNLWSNVEQSAQVASWEMLAFAAHSGNNIAAYALTREMRHVFMDIMLLNALRQRGGFNKYLEETKTFSWTPFDQAIIHARVEALPEKYLRLLNICEDYAQEPMSWIIRAHMDGTQAVKDLAFPRQYKQNTYAAYSSGSDTKPEEPLPYSVSNLLEFIQNAEQNAEDIREFGFIRNVTLNEWCKKNEMC